MKLYALGTTIILAITCAAGRGDEAASQKAATIKPTGDQIVRLLGLHPKHPLLRGMVKTLELKKSEKPGGFTDQSLWIAAGEYGVLSITFYCQDDENRKAYSGKLPAGISLDSTADALIKKFGEPSDDLAFADKSRTITWKDAIKGATLETEFDPKGKLKDVSVNGTGFGIPELAPSGLAKETIKQEVDRIAKIVPKGWKVSVEDDFISIARENPITEVTEGFQSDDGDKSAPAKANKEFCYTLWIGKPLTRDDLAKLHAKIDEDDKAADAIVARDAALPDDFDVEHLAPLDSPDHKKMSQAQLLHEESGDLYASLPEYLGKSVSWRELDSAGSNMIEFDKQDEADECHGVIAKVLGTYEKVAWSETTNKIVSEVNADLSKFYMQIKYFGPEALDAKDRPISLEASVRALKNKQPDIHYELISENRAASIIRRLAENGALDKMVDVSEKNFAMPAGPTYTLWIYPGNGKQWYVDLKWNLDMVDKLDLRANTRKDLAVTLAELSKKMQPRIEAWMRGEK